MGQSAQNRVRPVPRQVLTRGPVHEAFAEAVTFDPEPGIVVSEAPPAAIEELPPDQRPEGTNVAWIPGYWGWDDERSDFLWVSGVWRALPPGRQWVPGYWGQSAQGFQWTSGYWADAQVQTVTYLPEPPATVEAGPNVAASSSDHMWMPGCWVWHQNRYAWRPGFWAIVQPDWVWVPAHYVWAPRGYVFVDGYWDYAIGRRGVLFAPVYFTGRAYARPGYSYSPTIAIDLGVFANHLFLRPRYQHYYFGDYYAPNYQTAGYYSSYSYHSGRYGYDPIYAHQRWQHRQDGQWEQRVAADLENRRAHENLRPPRTWAAQTALVASGAGASERSLIVTRPFEQLRQSTDSRLRFRPVDIQERQTLVQQAREVQRLRAERYKLETQMPARLRVPQSPIVAKPVTDLGKDHTPPQAFPAPKPDPRVAPGPRVIRRGPGIPPVVERPQSQPRPQPQPQPRVDRPATKPQPQRKVERPTPQPRGKDPTGASSSGAKQGKDRDKGKEKK